MTPLDLSRLSALVKAATPGPWRDRRMTERAEDFCAIEADSPDNPENVVVIANMPGSQPYSHGEGRSNALLLVALRNHAESLIEAAQQAERLKLLLIEASGAITAALERLPLPVSDYRSLVARIDAELKPTRKGGGE